MHIFSRGGLHSAPEKAKICVYVVLINGLFLDSLGHFRYRENRTPFLTRYSLGRVATCKLSLTIIRPPCRAQKGTLRLIRHNTPLPLGLIP